MSLFYWIMVRRWDGMGRFGLMTDDFDTLLRLSLYTL
jgi:hypothetical protein